MIQPSRKPSAGSRLRRDQAPQRREAVGQQDRPLGVHVVLRLSPARERHLADHERVHPQLLQEPAPGALDVTRINVQGRHGRT